MDALGNGQAQADVYVLPTLHGLRRRFGDDEIWGLPLVRLNRDSLQRSVRRQLRWTFDIVGATVALVLAAPVIACVALAGRRGETSIRERVCFDDLYIDDWSLWSDVRILLRTAGAVLRGAGR